MARIARWMSAPLFAALLAGCGSDDGSGPGVSAKEKKLAEIRLDLEKMAAENHLPGLAWAIVEDGAILHTDSLGVASAETGEPLDPEMVVPTGSIAVKMLVAAELMRLDHEGKLSLDAPVTSVLPELALPAGSEATTLRQAVTMRAGLSSPLRKECSDPSLDSALEKLAFLAPPGEVFIYSSSGFTIGAKVIEKLEQQPFEQVLRERYLVPLGMGSGTFDATKAMAGSHADVHAIDDDGSWTTHPLNQLPNCAPGVDCSVCEDFRANAGLFLGATELAGLALAALAEQTPFDAALVAEMAAKDSATGMGDTYDYGYGLFSLESKGRRAVFAVTDYAGVAGSVTWIAGTGLGVVLLSNGSYAHRQTTQPLQKMTIAIANRFLPEPWEPPDLTTPPSAWQKYEGKYAGPIAAAPYEVRVEGSALTLRNMLWPEGYVATLHQGAPESNFAWVAGDTFQFEDPVVGKRTVTFFLGAAGGAKMQYLLDAGESWLLAKRVE